VKFFRHLSQLLQFMQLPREQRRIVFYSEGRAYWGHLQPLIHGLLDSADISVCYITSSVDDPGLAFTHDRFNHFLTDQGWIRNWLFENIDTDIMIMTMPDLDQYQIKRSRHRVHYVYVQHSLVSLHMAYRKGAFDHFDTVLCAGPYHQEEVRAMEKHDALPEKHTVPHSYSRLFDIITEAQKHPHKQSTRDAEHHILIAPSWGPQGLIETMGCELVQLLLDSRFRITLRPHPQTSKFASDQIDAILNKFGGNPLFTLETDVSGQESLQQSDIMISDWSGAALEYAFGLGKPVLFIDVPRKMNNPDYEQIGLPPFEEWVRERIGSLLPPADLHRAPAILADMLNSSQLVTDIETLRRRCLFEPRVDQGAVNHILNIVRENSH